MPARFRLLPLILGCCLLLAGCQTQLFGSLTETEANAVLAALRSAAIKAEKKAGGEGTFAISVDEADFARAVKLLEEQALPARTYADFGTVFGGNAMFSTPLEDKARYLYALQEDLAHTVASIDGVLQARVHLVLQEQDQLGRQMHEPSAAVMVKYIDDARHDPVGHLSSIRKIIGAAVPNMKDENIQVSFVPAAKAEATQPQTWREVAGVRMMPGDESRFFLLLGIPAGLCLLLLAALTAVWLKGRRGPGK